MLVCLPASSIYLLVELFDISVKSESSIPGERSEERSEGKLTRDNLHPLNMTRGTRTVYPCKRNKGLSSTFQPPEEGHSIQQPKRYDEQGDKDEGNIPKNINNVQSTSSQKYRQFFFSNILICFFCSALTRYLLFLPSFAKIFWFLKSSRIVRLLVTLFFSSQPIFLCVCVFFFFSFACRHNFLTCPSLLISHTGFVFLFRFLRAAPNLSQTNLALA